MVLIALSFPLGCSTLSPKPAIESEGEDYRIVIRDKDPALSEARAWELAKEFCAEKGKRAIITHTDSKAIGAVTKKPLSVAQVKSRTKKTSALTQDAFVSIAEKDHEAILYFQCLD